MVVADAMHSAWFYFAMNSGFQNDFPRWIFHAHNDFAGNAKHVVRDFSMKMKWPTFSHLKFDDSDFDVFCLNYDFFFFHFRRLTFGIPGGDAKIRLPPQSDFAFQFC